MVRPIKRLQVNQLVNVPALTLRMFPYMLAATSALSRLLKRCGGAYGAGATRRNGAPAFNPYSFVPTERFALDHDLVAMLETLPQSRSQLFTQHHAATAGPSTEVRLVSITPRSLHRRSLWPFWGLYLSNEGKRALQQRSERVCMVVMPTSHTARSETQGATLPDGNIQHCCL